jgi:hypothetical protein
MDNLRTDIRLLSSPGVLNPYYQETSSSRLDMFRRHIGQALVMDGCELPQIFTGKEMDAARYELNASKRDQDGQVIAVIPKYLPGGGAFGILENPSRTVIYIGQNDHCLHYFTLSSHFMAGDGFGYENIFENEHLLLRDSYLPKEAVLSHSPAIQGNKYCLGVNANVAYTTQPETIEDAMMISQSLADKMTTRELRRIIINIKPHEHPVNYYGDNENNFKFMPDIGETTDEKGILAVFRPVETSTFAADMHPDHMTQVQEQHDRVIRIHPYAKIVDIDCYACSKRDMIPWTVYGQAEKYIDAIKTYWERILRIYDQYKGRYGLSPQFNTLVTTAMLHLSAHGGRVHGINSRKVRFVTRSEQPVDFLQIHVTYMAKRKTTVGFKITDRFGTLVWLN